MVTHALCQPETRSKPGLHKIAERVRTGVSCVAPDGRRPGPSTRSDRFCVLWSQSHRVDLGPGVTFRYGFRVKRFSTFISRMWKKCALVGRGVPGGSTP